MLSNLLDNDIIFSPPLRGMEKLYKKFIFKPSEYIGSRVILSVEGNVANHYPLVELVKDHEPDSGVFTRLANNPVISQDYGTVLEVEVIFTTIKTYEEWGKIWESHPPNIKEWDSEWTEIIVAWRRVTVDNDEQET